MKKIIIGLCVIIVIQALCIVYMNSAIGQNTKHIEALEQYTKAQIYKKRCTALSYEFSMEQPRSS